MCLTQNATIWTGPVEHNHLNTHGMTTYHVATIVYRTIFTATIPNLSRNVDCEWITSRKNYIVEKEQCRSTALEDPDVLLEAYIRFEPRFSLRQEADQTADGVVLTRNNEI